MVDSYSSGRKTVCWDCTDRYPGCHNCEKRQAEIDKDNARKEEQKRAAVTDAFERRKKPRRRKSLMRRY